MHLKTKRALKIAANAIKKMHVPAYWPVVVGVHCIEKSVVLVEVKKAIAIESIPITMLLSDDIDILSPVEVAIAMLDIVIVGCIDIDTDADVIVLMELIIDIAEVAMIANASIGLNKTLLSVEFG